MTPLNVTRDLRLAVVQLAATPGEREHGAREVEDLVRETAREHDPDMILLPDCCTGALAPGRSTRASAEPESGPFYELLRRLAREHGCWIGGGYLAVRGAAARGLYVLAEPGGATHLHDRDAIAPWEGAFIAPGKDDGFCATPLGPIGIAAGLEWFQPDTVSRLKGLVRMVVGGTCLLSSSGPLPWLSGLVGVSNDSAAAVAPAMARSLGVPVAVAQQAGAIPSVGTIPGLRRTVALSGGSAIVDRDGTVLAEMSARDGRGYAAATVRLGAIPAWEARPDGSGLPRPLPAHPLSALHGLSGRWQYRRRGAAAAYAISPDGAEALMAYNPPPDLPRSERYECRPLVAAGSAAQ